MRVFVCEFVTGGGFSDVEMPDGLRREGDMMLRALVKDLADLPGISVAVARDRRLPAIEAARLHWVEPGEDPWPAWRRHMADADAVLPVAPETDRLLARLSELVIESGRRLLGSRPDAVDCTASKLRTARHLSQHAVAVVPTAALCEALAEGLPASAAGWIVKPDDGAGCEDTFLMREEIALRRWAAARRDVARFVIQPYRVGRATSLSLLCAEGRALLLGCNEQDIRLEDDRLRYHGGTVGGAEDRRDLYEPVAAAIAAAMPGLWGHAGVDLVETEGGPVVLEVNPRVTTSYVGLRRVLGRNPAELLLRLSEHGCAGLDNPVREREAVRIHVGA